MAGLDILTVLFHSLLQDMGDMVQLEQGIRDRLVEHESLVDALLQEREQIRGSLFSRFAMCGKTNCVCAQGEKHGPYYVLSNRSGGEGAFVYLKQEQVGRVTNNPTLRAKGKAENLAGKIQKKVGQLEKVFEK